jgi:selenium metabolism protein YedF
MKTLDVRGLACPEPIVRAKRALVDDREPAVALLVDSAVTRENLRKFAAAKGFRWDEEGGAGQWHITLTSDAAGDGPAAAPAPAARAAVVLCAKKTLGAPNGELGGILIRAFFKTLVDLDNQPEAVIFINEGVHLPCADEAIVEHCRALAERGVEIVSCGTCLDYFHLLDQLKVGRVGNMYDIADTLLRAGAVVAP